METGSWSIMNVPDAIAREVYQYCRPSLHFFVCLDHFDRDRRTLIYLRLFSCAFLPFV